jgi:hypothetical protein
MPRCPSEPEKPASAGGEAGPFPEAGPEKERVLSGYRMLALIINAMESKRYSTYRLAKELGWEPDYLTIRIGGLRPFLRSEIHQVAEALGLDADQLLNPGGYSCELCGATGSAPTHRTDCPRYHLLHARPDPRTEQLAVAS